MATIEVTYVITAGDEAELTRVLEQTQHFNGTVESVNGLEITLHATASQAF